jgi:hypothetical protein
LGACRSVPPALLARPRRARRRNRSVLDWAD